MPELHQFARIEFSRFKAFNRFTLSLRNFNILVGPNNAGKSTILTAFRILAAAMRRAQARRSRSFAVPQEELTAIQLICGPSQ
jgi:predicted ATPase